MGSEILSDSIPLITGSVLSHTPIKNVEIVKYNGMNYEIIPLGLEGNSSSIKFTHRDSLYVRSSFYYLRVTSTGNVNNRFAWSSPVWVNKPVISALVELPAMSEYGYFKESDSAYKYEIGFNSRFDSLPFSVNDNLSIEAYNIQGSNEVSVFVNGIFLSFLNTTAENSWGTAESLHIPKYLVDSLNVIRFENANALLNNEISEWGVRNLRLSSQKISVSTVKTNIIRSYDFPNPFNPLTTIEYSLQYRTEISLIIYNLRGQEVIRLVDEEKPAGLHSAHWDASNLASGVYLYRLQAGDFVQTMKMLLLK